MTVIAKVFAELGPWNWWILGLVLLGFEILVPGFVFLWFGVSAILVGTLALFVSISWQTAVILFLVLSFATLFLGRRLMSRVSSENGDPGLNKRGSRYVGREFVLTEPIAQGSGRLSIDDTVWRISGPDLPAGSRVRVVEVKGVRLVVSGT